MCVSRLAKWYSCTLVPLVVSGYPWCFLGNLTMLFNNQICTIAIHIPVIKTLFLTIVLPGVFVMLCLECCHETKTTIFATRTNLPVLGFQIWKVWFNMIFCQTNESVHICDMTWCCDIYSVYVCQCPLIHAFMWDLNSLCVFICCSLV